MTSITSLPPIKVGGQVTQQVIKQVPSPPSKMASSGSPIMRTRVVFKSDGSSRGGLTSSEKSSSFEKIETAKYRNSYEHNLCLEMLKDGYHQSFSEMFNLMSRQKEGREKLGRNSGVFDYPLLEDEPDKLDKLKHHLITSEAARRRGKMDIVYQSLLSLARYFEDCGDSWLANHFYDSCLKTSLKIRGDGRKKESEANCNMGLSWEKEGDLFKAVEYFESFYNLTKGRLWQNDQGEILHSKACENLRRIHTAISDGLKEEDMVECINYLLKAYEMAKESGDGQQEGLAGHRLGLAYEDVEDAETAILYHNGYLEKCQQLSDDIGMGRACQALARAYETQGDIESAMKYLEMFVDLADRAQQLPEQQSACSSLGEMYNSLGKYYDGVQMFKRSYEIAQDLGNPVITEDARIQLGIASAHHVLSGLCSTMNDLHKNNLQKILDFKSARQDAFLEEIYGSSESKKEEVPAPESQSDKKEAPEDETVDETIQDAEQQQVELQADFKSVETVDDENDEQITEQQNNGS